jgi:tripartite-type tricarboxylate transporter receptor subunit TctC
MMRWRASLPRRCLARSASRSWWRTAAAPAGPSRRGRSPRARPTDTPSCSPYTGTLCINPTLYSNAGYDPRKDFAPIGLIGSQPSVLTVHPSLPARTPSELVAYATANPGKVNYAFVPGTIGQMTTEMFARSAGIELTRIPYKGNGQAIGDLIGGHVSMMVLSLSTILGSVKVRPAVRARRDHAGALQASA